MTKKIKTEEENTSKLFYETLNNISTWKRIWWDFQFQCKMMWHDLHSDEYRKDKWILKHLFLFKLFGFKPIMLGSYFGEDTFVFKTEEEAIKGFEFFERGNKIPKEGIEEEDKLPKYRNWITGWWYSKDSLIKELEKIKTDYPDGGNIIDGYSSDLRNSSLDDNLNFVKLWEEKNEK
jgi:hypothetical protein